MSHKLFIRTFGCQMNEYDSARIADQLSDKIGFAPCEDEQSADLLVVNTCSVREKAQEKLFSLLGRWRAIKEARPGTMIAVGGCVASQEGEYIQSRAPFVDVVFGPQTLHRLPDLIAEAKQRQHTAVDVSFPEIEKFDRLPEPRVDGPSAYVSIMEGCSKYCTFCVVPYTRGEEISRPFADVMREVEGLAKHGVKEINFLGQNVNAYAGPMDDEDEPADLALLLHYAAEVPGIERLRYTTSHPLEMNDALIEAFAEIPQLAGHLHLPVQSGSNRILAMMKRNHTADDYLKIIERLRAVRPDLVMSSDFIVGFPGETEEDFQATMDLVDAVGYDRSFSFIYSQRPGTPAAALHDDTPPEVYSERLQRLQARLRHWEAEHSKRLLGTVQRVLVGRPARKGEGDMSGRTECNRVVNFPGGTNLIGTMVDVKITEVLPNSLRGEQLV
ncbi:MAG: tRNA (N6-isopentenyl adenosine(37)-C2)-methylthiotransferase MiaB [Gammaproteobacteria bacterium]